jgi:hypothetical protein
MRKALLALAMVFILSSFSYAADLSLRATWTANVDSVTVGYKIYRTDATRTLVATVPGKAVATYTFPVTVPDASSGTLRFVMTAYSATKESADSNTVSVPFDLTPVPAVPASFGVVIQ